MVVVILIMTLSMTVNDERMTLINSATPVFTDSSVEMTKEPNNYLAK